MSAVPFTEVRTTSGFKYNDTHGIFGFSGFGVKRADHANASARRLHALASKVDGILPGTVKVTRLTGTASAFEWYSLRSVGVKGDGRTVYVRADAIIAVCGEPVTTMGQFYRSHTA